MLMLRVRGALATAVEQLEDGASSQDVDMSKVVQSVSSSVTKMLESKIDPDKGLMLVTKDSLKLLADSIVSAISDAVTSQNTEDEEENQPDVVKTAPLSDDAAEKS